MIIKHFSQSQALRHVFQARKDHAWIQITDPGRMLPHLREFSPKVKRTLQVKFPHYSLPRKTAGRILAFAQSLPKGMPLNIHCDHGQHRSYAIAAALERRLNGKGRRVDETDMVFQNMLEAE